MEREPSLADKIIGFYKSANEFFLVAAFCICVSLSAFSFLCSFVFAISGHVLAPIAFLVFLVLGIWLLIIPSIFVFTHIIYSIFSDLKEVRDLMRILVKEKQPFLTPEEASRDDQE